MTDHEGIDMHNDTDRVLQGIETVTRDWAVSSDAMRCRYGLTPSTATLAGAAASLSEAFRVLAEAIRPTVEYFRSPEGRLLLASFQEVEPEATEACHCLCSVRHPELQACEGEVAEGAGEAVTIGDYEIHMCVGCATAR